MHGRCWSHRALARLQCEQARITRLAAAAASSPLDSTVDPSSPTVSVAASADCQSAAFNEGEADAVSDGDDCGLLVRLLDSVLASGGEGDGWWCVLPAWLGDVPAGDEVADEDEEAEKAKDVVDVTDEGEAAAWVMPCTGGSSPCLSASESGCCCCMASGDCAARREDDRREEGWTAQAVGGGRAPLSAHLGRVRYRTQDAERHAARSVTPTHHERGRGRLAGEVLVGCWWKGW